MKAANQRETIGQFGIGTTYRSVQGASQDHSKAAEPLSNAINQGNAIAQIDIDEVFKIGKGS